MLQALWSASSGMLAQQIFIDTVANNIANVNTPGYKKSRVEFQDLLYSPVREPGQVTRTGQVIENGIQTGAGTRLAAVRMLFEQGGLQVTGNPTDLVISGDAFFEILLPDGSKAYTRDGSFRIDADGNLVTGNNNSVNVESKEGGLLKFTEGVAAIKINSSGEIFKKTDLSSVPEQVGRLNIVRFPNPAGLERTGSNLYRETANSGTPQPTEDFKVTTGSLEMSNVQIVEEMVNMITAQRAYELCSRSVRNSDEMLAQANGLLRR